MSREFLDCLKRERDIRIKPKLSGGKTAFSCTPTLMAKAQNNVYSKSALPCSSLTRFYFLPNRYMSRIFPKSIE